jgi:hypothetical protein
MFEFSQRLETQAGQDIRIFACSIFVPKTYTFVIFGFAAFLRIACGTVL